MTADRRPVLGPAPWPRGLDPDDVDQVLVVFSDVEMGAGGHTDDFPQSDFLGQLLETYNEGPHAERPVTVVFNGDTFDLLKTSVGGAYPTRITADVATRKMGRVMGVHEAFFDRLCRFADHPRAPRHVELVVGNHDYELFFPEVQAMLQARVGPSVGFPGESLRIGDVRIEHGHQSDPLFSLEEGQPFVDIAGERVLNLPWGAVALLEVMIPLAPVLCALDRMRPRDAVLTDLPEVKDLLLSSFWHYWTRDYWRDFFAEADPMKRASWTMLREIAFRFGTGYADVSMGDFYRRRLQQEGRHLTLVGHQHDPGWWSRGRRRVLRTGCFRNEYTFDRRTAADYEQLPKVYAEVFLKDGHVRRAHLVEVDAPPPPPGYLPASLRDVLPEVRRLLARGDVDLERERADRAAQEEKERATGTTEASGFDFIRNLRQSLLGD